MGAFTLGSPSIGAVPGTTIREICQQLNADAIPPPIGKPTWSHSTISRLLHNEAYVGRVYFNRTEMIARSGSIVIDEQFQAAGRVSRDNSQWSHGTPDHASRRRR